jgi:hypothetical protein
MTDEELKELVASLAISQQKTEEQMRRTDEQLKRTDEKLERMGIHLSGIGQNQGDVAEEFFFNSLIKDNRLGSIHFDDIERGKSKHRGKIQEEYDLFMTNGDAIAVVEVKYKAHSKDLDKLDRKMANFKTLYPIYQNYKLYGALASFHIHDNLKNEALERGYFVLQRSGELVHTECGENLKTL